MNEPNLIVLIPYRDRKEHKYFFQTYMKQNILKDMKNYEIWFIEQGDDRCFNRGAMKNIGFLFVKNQYPETYKQKTIVFHDIDTLPYHSQLIDYYTQKGIIKHFYGFDFALGGIVSINAEDFESINGFANFWTWGFEDNILNIRAKKKNIMIDRTNWFPLGDMRILHLFDGYKKNLNKKYLYDMVLDDGFTGLSTIHDLSFQINEKENIVKITSFETEYDYKKGEEIEYDSRNGRDISLPMNEKILEKYETIINDVDTLHFLDKDGQKINLKQYLQMKNNEQQQKSKNFMNVFQKTNKNISYQENKTKFKMLGMK